MEMVCPGYFWEPMGLANGLDMQSEGKGGVRVSPNIGVLDGKWGVQAQESHPLRSLADRDTKIGPGSLNPGGQGRLFGEAQSPW